MPRKLKHDDARVLCWRVVADVGEAEVAGDEAALFCLRARRDCRVGGAAQVRIASVNDFVTVATNDARGGSGQVRINQKAHRLSPRGRRGGQGVMFLLFDQLARVGQRRTDIV